MRVVSIAAGAAGMYCGSCLRDNALARGLGELGEDVLLVPTYTPLRVDEENASGERVFFGAVDVYLDQTFSGRRDRRGPIRRVLGSQAVLRWLSRLTLGTSPGRLGEVTVSMLRGEEGNQRRSLLELADWLEREARPEVIHLSNSLLSGMARELKRRLRVPIVCSLQGEDFFIDGLPEPHRRQALDLIHERAGDIDRYTATSRFAAERMAEWARLDRSQIDVVLPGISLTDYEAPGAPSWPPAGGRPLTIGYLARISPEKGLNVLADAFRRLSASGEFPALRLRAAGFLGSGDLRYASAVRHALARWGLGDRFELLGTVGRAEKLEFLRSIDVLAVPTVYPEPKGLFVLEALASGVPVVQPRHGSFPELIEATGGGLLHEPSNPEDLAARLADVLRDPALRSELGWRGREAVHARFSARRMAEETREVYRRTLSRG